MVACNSMGQALSTETDDPIGYAVKIGANAASMAAQLGHSTVEEGLGDLIARAREPRSRVVVCGGFKQGKSSVVNGLLNARIGPADPLVATAVPLVIVDGDLDASVYVDAAGERRVSTIAPTDLAAVMRGETTEHDGHPIVGALVRQRRGLLSRGIVLVDTPPISGGLASAEAILVLGEIRQARAVIFCTDSSQELTAPELEFIEAARRLCPSLVVCQTKTDLYPEWSRLRDINQGRLRDIGATGEVVAVSSSLRQRGVRLDDEEILEQSGYPTLSQFLVHDVLGGATALLIRNLAENAAHACTQMAEPLAVELQALQQPAEIAALRERAELASQRVVAFSSGDGSWERVLKRELRRINDDSRYNVQVALKELERWAMERIDDADPAQSWMDFEGRLQRETTRVVVDHLAFIRDEAEKAVGEVADVVAQEASDLGIEVEGFRVPFDPADLELDDTDFGGAMRGAQTGMMAGRFAAAAGATVWAVSAGVGAVVAAPLAVGAAAVTGIVFAAGGRRSSLERRQQAARQAAQKYLRDARLLAEKASNDAVNHTQDQLVEEFERLVRELRDRVELELAALAEAEERHEAEKPARMAGLREALGKLKTIHAHAQRVIAA